MSCRSNALGPREEEKRLDLTRAKETPGEVSSSEPTRKPPEGRSKLRVSVFVWTPPHLERADTWKHHVYSHMTNLSPLGRPLAAGSAQERYGRWNLSAAVRRTVSRTWREPGAPPTR